MSKKFDELNSRLLPSALSLLQKWLPAGVLHGREYCVGNIRGEAGESLKINIDTAIGKEFAGGAGYGDLIALYADINGISQFDAFKALGGHTREETTYISGQTCTKIPKNRRLQIHPAVIYEYRDEKGRPIGYNCRFEPIGKKKEFLPLTFRRKKDGTAYWSYKKWPQLSPLYRLPELLARPDADVLLVEGEGKCDSAQSRFVPDMAVTAWPGGSKAIATVDWSHLKDRNVWMWPDADKPGISAAAMIKTVLPHAKIVDVAKIPGITITDNNGWDLKDAPDDFNVKKYLVEDVAISALPIVKNSEYIDLDARTAKINHEYAVVIHGAKVFVMRHWTNELGYSDLAFFTSRDFLLLSKNNNIYKEDDSGKVKKINVGEHWLEWEGRQQFEAAYFEPCGKEYKTRYNLWRGFAVQHAPTGQFNLFLTHIHDNICQKNEERYTWVMSWLADLFQKPFRKLGTALVLRGAMGIGKGAFASHIGYLLGKHYMTITQSGQLVGKFNSHMADKLLMFVDEGWWSDERKGEGILRALITENQVTIEMKGKDAVTMANYTRFIIAANAKWVVPVSASDERRFVIMDVADTNQRDNTYFAAIENQLKNGGYEGLLHYLLNYSYDEALPRSIISTAALVDNKLHSLKPEIRWYYNCLINGEIGEFQLSDETENQISTKVFYEAYLKTCHDMKIMGILSDNALPKEIKETKVVYIKRRETGSDGKRYWTYVFPRLHEMREAFEVYLGGKIDWNII